MQTTVNGYAVRFKVSLSNGTSKLIAGTTQDDLTVTPTTKESITKDDLGIKRLVTTGNETTFSATFEIGYGDAVENNASGVLELAYLQGSDAIIPFQYYRPDGTDTYTKLSGNCSVTSYKESSGSSDVATATVEFKTQGVVTRTYNTTLS